MKKEEKTNVMRLLEVNNVNYKEHIYDSEKAISAIEVANILNQSVEQVFKTLVTVSKSGEHYVFVIPANEELNLKKAAKCSKEKYIEMLPQKDLLSLTGYVHGGCSPFGMKKIFKTYIDETALLFDTICVSGGKRGYQVEINPLDIEKILPVEFVSLTI